MSQFATRCVVANLPPSNIFNWLTMHSKIICLCLVDSLEGFTAHRTIKYNFFCFRVVDGNSNGWDPGRQLSEAGMMLASPNYIRQIPASAIPKVRASSHRRIRSLQKGLGPYLPELRLPWKKKNRADKRMTPSLILMLCRPTFLSPESILSQIIGSFHAGRTSAVAILESCDHQKTVGRSGYNRSLYSDGTNNCPTPSYDCRREGREQKPFGRKKLKYFGSWL